MTILEYIYRALQGQMPKLRLSRRLLPWPRRKRPEQALREKHEARVVEAEREPQEVIGRNESLWQSISLKESELAQALQAADDAREEARGALKDIQEARRVAASKAFCT